MDLRTGQHSTYNYKPSLITMSGYPETRPRNSRDKLPKFYAVLQPERIRRHRWALNGCVEDLQLAAAHRCQLKASI